jgi:transcriptional regulator with XRE-family HTH domain
MPSAIFSQRYAVAVKALVAARKRAGITQADLATRLGRLQSYISKVERLERRLDFIEFDEWISALALRSDEIISPRDAGSNAASLPE